MVERLRERIVTLDAPGGALFPLLLLGLSMVAPWLAFQYWFQYQKGNLLLPSLIFIVVLLAVPVLWALTIPFAQAAVRNSVRYQSQVRMALIFLAFVVGMADAVELIYFVILLLVQGTPI